MANLTKHAKQCQTCHRPTVNRGGICYRCLDGMSPAP